MLKESEQKQLFQYFKPKIKMTTCKLGVGVCYYLGLSNGIVGAYIYELHNMVNNKIEIIDKCNLIDQSISYEDIVEYSKTQYGDDFDNMLNKYKQEYYEKLNQNQRNEFISEIAKMPGIAISKEQGKLLANNLISVEYYFTQEDEHIYLSLKVGNSKYYIVKNIDEFFFAINNNKLIDYGKQLSFYHRKDNFIKQDQLALEIIDEIKRNPLYNNNKECLIPLKSFKNVMDALKGRKVYFNGLPYLVRLNKINVEIKIDENYCLHSKLKKDDILINTSREIFIVKNDSETIDIVDCNYKTNELVNLSFKFDGFNIKPLLNSFLTNVYMFHYDSITVDSKIEKEFKIKSIEIEAYFDYQAGGIIVTPKYIKSDQELEENQIIDYYDVNKLKSFKSYLSELGFVDFTLKKQEDIYRFLTMDLFYLKKLCKVYLSENITSKQIIKFKLPQISVKYQNNLMSFLLDNSEFTDEELYKILKAIRKKQQYFLLNKNTIIDLTDKQAITFNEIVTDLDLCEKKLTKEMEKPLYQTFKLKRYLNDINIDSYIQNMINDIANFKNAEMEVPKVNTKLRTYQIEGYKWLRTLAKYNLGGILADDMGLGKTLEIITFLKSDKALKPSIIICPKSLIFNWHSEFEKFDKSTNVVEIYGNQQERKKIIENIKPNEKVIYITSYDSLRNDEDDYKVEFNYVIIDEGQYIKNINAKKTKTVKQLISKNRIALTGTPIENNVFDLWSLFDFIMPNYLPPLNDFKSEITDENYYNELSKKIAPFILRRTKKEVLKDLPNKYERIVTADLTEEQKKIYDSYVLQVKNMLKEENKTMQVLSIITRLRQICVDPNTFIDNYNGTSGKMEILVNLIEEYIKNNHRIVIFSQFVKALEILSNQLIKMNINFRMLTGETKAKERVSLSEQFNTNDQIKVMLISLKAGGTGLNLIGADTVIHLDPWWNQSAENQASDRAYRIGQEKAVEVIKLICRDTIEQRVIELQNIKQDLINKLISNDDTSITKLSKEDLEYILK